MKNIFCFFLLCSLFTSMFGQEDSFNLDFEKVANEKPADWYVFGSKEYSTALDTNKAQSGNNAVIIEYHGDSPTFGAWAFNIPAKYKGKTVKLSGYIKTENVTDGYAGLWMRIDPRVAFDNMHDRGVTGTTDWVKYDIELELNSNADQIVVGGLLAGKGKMWIDNLTVTIDGTPLQEAPLKDLLPADKDKEFDNGSGIVLPQLTEKLISDLDLLGKVWGFLKYHHPEIGKGQYHWDYELFRFLPRYLSATNNSQRDTLISEWIHSLGKLEACSSCKEAPEDAFLKPDLNWIETSELSTALKRDLYHVKQNRHQGTHYYIGMSQYVGNPEFSNEHAYSNMPFPDEGFRLLALYKYWNIIHYYFPYKHLIDVDWNANLKKYIPVFIDAKNELEYEQAAVQIIGDIKDTHANLWSGNDAIREYRGQYYPPVKVRFVENQLVVVDYFNPEMKDVVGLEHGDIITKINNVPVATIIKDRLPYYPASNYRTQLRDIAGSILKSNSKSIDIHFIRDKNEVPKTMDLYQISELDYYNWYRRDPDGTSYKMLDNNIGYITLKNIKEEDIKKIKEQFKDTKGIIIDIRNYPSTFVPFLLGSYFVSSDTPFVKFTSGNVDNPGEFTFGNTLSIPSEDNTYQGKLIVIVNELSQSQAEYTAMAFRAGDNTTIIGSTTAAADGNVSTFTLPGGLGTMISGIGVYYPDGTETQRVGILPDVEVLPTIKGVKAGEDELLNKAIELILKDIRLKNQIKD